MIRLTLVLAPAVCVMAGIGVSHAIRIFTDSIFHFLINLNPNLSIGKEKKEALKKKLVQGQKNDYRLKTPILGPFSSFVGIFGFSILICMYIFYSTLAGA